MKQYDQATQAQERVLDKLLELVEVPVPRSSSRTRSTPVSTTSSTTSSARWA